MAEEEQELVKTNQSIMTKDEQELVQTNEIIVTDQQCLLNKCIVSLESIVKGGDVSEFMNFTPILLQFMTQDLPDDPMRLSRELGLRAVQILGATKRICDETECENEITLLHSESSIVLFLTGMFMRYEHFQLFGAVLFVRMMIMTDKFCHIRRFIEYRKNALFCTVALLNWNRSILYNISYTAFCALMWSRFTCTKQHKP